MMNPFKVTMQIGIVSVLISLSGCKKTEPVNVISVTTDEIELYVEGIYTFNGNVTGIAKDGISMHGFYWSETQSPEKDGIVIELGPRSSAGTFSSIVYDVLPRKTYYVRAFAITNSVYYYGEVKTFTTPDTIVYPVVDIDHNIYHYVKIGNQTWLTENLKSAHFPDGSVIQRVETQADWYNFNMWTKAYCWYENFASLAAQYGCLYTWPAAMNASSESDLKPGNIQGVCPDGWHIPSDDEWKQLEMNLGMSQADADMEKWRGTDEGGKLKNTGILAWASPNTGATNESGFSGMPGGYRDGAGYFQNYEKAARFWSSTKRGDFVWVRQLDYNTSQINRITQGVYAGMSVRCIKDTP
jgi:uncharacterized protein (TIGR02145 family)